MAFHHSLTHTVYSSSSRLRPSVSPGRKRKKEKRERERVRKKEIDRESGTRNVILIVIFLRQARPVGMREVKASVGDKQTEGESGEAGGK